MGTASAGPHLAGQEDGASYEQKCARSRHRTQQRIGESRHLHATHALALSVYVPATSAGSVEHFPLPVVQVPVPAGSNLSLVSSHAARITRCAAHCAGLRTDSDLCGYFLRTKRLQGWH